VKYKESSGVGHVAINTRGVKTPQSRLRHFLSSLSFIITFSISLFFYSLVLLFSFLDLAKRA